MSDLAKRAIACKHWRWMPGMLVRYGDGKAWYRLTGGDGYPRDAWPDLDDPCTLGGLLALVREAWGDLAHVSTTVTIWDAGRISYGVEGVDAAGGLVDLVGSYREGPEEALICWSEAAALIAALESAP